MKLKYFMSKVVLCVDTNQRSGRMYRIEIKHLHGKFRLKMKVVGPPEFW
jgi:hypothetical protein